MRRPRETTEAALAFRYLKELRSGLQETASHARVSWNHTREWLSEMESLRQSLSEPPGSARKVRISPAWE